MTGSCQLSPGSRVSPYCWIAANSWGHGLKCVTKSDCAEAALNWGRCIFGSCAFDRASRRTCDEMNSRNLGELKKECDTRGFSFDSWAKRYYKAVKLFNRFSPCFSKQIEDQTKKVIKYCHCFNSCGKIRLKMAPAQSAAWIGDWIWSWTSNHPTQRCKFFILTKLHSLNFPSVVVPLFW